MRVIIVGTAYPLRGGIAHYNALLYQELRTKHDVQIITFKRQYPAFLFPGTTQVETEGEMLRVPSEPLMDSINPLNWLAVGRAIRGRRPDVLIFKYWLPFFGPCFGTIARVAKRDTTKVLFICDNVIPHEHRPGDAAFTRYAFGPVDGFIAQSETVQRDLLRFWPKAKFRNVPHPVYNIFGALKEKVAARAALGITAPRIILFFGYIRRYKGLHVLLDAMAALDPSLSIHLLVVGEFYDDKEKYQEQIAALGITDRVTIRSEYVSNASVGGYFSAADVVVLPYISATQSGIAQIAYNFDKPVIATAVGGLAEVVVDNVTGFLVPPEEPQALARAISRFFIEGKENVFAANVREEKKKYTWSALVSALEELATA